jgi:hypothetical protein
MCLLKGTNSTESVTYGVRTRRVFRQITEQMGARESLMRCL